METRARYALVGSFALAVVLCAVGFVLWLERPGGFTQRTAYRIRFERSVSGLQTGAAVQFDGIKVGEVTGLVIDPRDPSRIVVSIAVATDTPIRADTKVGIESQGLMGTSAVALEGGSAAAPAMAEAPGGPLLVADAAAGRSLTESAKETLDKVDRLIGDNSDAMTSIIGNVRTFSVALARNSGRLDSVMAGLEKMAGGPPKAAPRFYDLTLPQVLASDAAKAMPQIAVAEPSALGELQSQKLLVRNADGEIAQLGEARWTDLLPKVVQAKVVEAFGPAALPAGMPDPMATPPAPQRQLRIDIRSFDLTMAGPPTAVVTLAVAVVSPEGRILASRVFSASTQSTSSEVPAAVAAFDSAFGKVANDLVTWLPGVA